MQQEEKQAAAAARELLKAEALREQKAFAEQSRKGSSASSARKTAEAQKGKARGGAVVRKTTEVQKVPPLSSLPISSATRRVPCRDSGFILQFESLLSLRHNCNEHAWS